MGLGDRFEDRVLVQRHERAQIEHLGVDAIHDQKSGGLQAGGDHGRPRNERHIAAPALHVRLAERDDILAFGNLLLHLLKPLVLHEDHGVVVPDGRDDEAFGIGGSRRGHRLQTGNVGHKRFQRLRMMGSVRPGGSARYPDHHRHLVLPGEHIVSLGGLVGELVEADADEVHEHDLHHGPQAYRRRPYRMADDRRLHDGGVAYPLGAELLEHPVAGDALGNAELPHFFSGHVDVRVAPHLKRDAVGDGGAIAHHARAHSQASPA